MPKFGGFANAMMEENAYQPANNSGNVSGNNSSFGQFLSINKTSSATKQRKMPVSTRADISTDVFLPGEVVTSETEQINDISNIVQETSNIEDTSFTITIGEFKNGLAASRPKAGISCKCSSYLSLVLSSL